jgi:hypothetical protein
MNITTEQIQDLWHGHTTRLDRGDAYPVITRADVAALIEGGDIDTDDDGVPLDTEWAVLAEALNDADNDAPRERALTEIEDAVRRLTQAEEDRNELIVAAINAGASVISIANAAGLTRARIYQIRDGRR